MLVIFSFIGLLLTSRHIEVLGGFFLSSEPSPLEGNNVCLDSFIKLQCEARETTDDIIRWFTATNYTNLENSLVPISGFTITPSTMVPQSIPLQYIIPGLLEIYLDSIQYHTERGTFSYNSTLHINASAYYNREVAYNSTLNLNMILYAREVHSISCGTFNPELRSDWISLNFSIKYPVPPVSVAVTVKYLATLIQIITVNWHHGHANRNNNIERICSYLYIVKLKSITNNSTQLHDAVIIPFSDCVGYACSTTFQIAVNVEGNDTFIVDVSATDRMQQYYTTTTAIEATVVASIRDLVNYTILTNNCSSLEFSCWTSIPSVNTCSIHYRAKQWDGEFSVHHIPVNTTAFLMTDIKQFVQYEYYLSMLTENEMLTLQILEIFDFTPYKNLTPTELTLIPLEQPGVFLVTWTPVLPEILSYYTIVINPPSLHGMTTIITSDSSVILRLNKTMQYNVSLTSTLCLGLNSNTANFIIGYCSFLAVIPPLNVQYRGGLNHSQSALVTCIDGRELSLQCGVDGEWVDVSTDKINSYAEFSKCMAASSNSTQDKASTTQDPLESQETSECVALTSSISVIALVLLTLIGSIMFLSGMFYGIRHAKQKQKLQKDVSNQQQVNEPIYDEVNQLNEPVKLWKIP